MFFTGVTVPGSPGVPNEDWVSATPGLVVVLDGATVRTATGCVHGAAWYARELGAAVIAGAVSRSTPLTGVLAAAINEVAGRHPECDLSHPGTPSAAIAVVRVEEDALRWLVLGDVTLVLDTTTGVRVISDQRVSATAPAERAEVDRHLIGSPGKATALVPMKRAELAARNRPGGYWIAAVDPLVVDQAIIGGVPLAGVRRLAVLTDGAARAVDMFQSHRSWPAALDEIAEIGPREFIQQVRAGEARDPLGAAFPRNKASDDATLVFAEPVPIAVKERPVPVDERPLPPIEERMAMADELLARTAGAYGDGMSHRARAERLTEAVGH